jgi:hypothetical protein
MVNLLLEAETEVETNFSNSILRLEILSHMMMLTKPLQSILVVKIEISYLINEETIGSKCLDMNKMVTSLTQEVNASMSIEEEIEKVNK